MFRGDSGTMAGRNRNEGRGRNNGSLAVAPGGVCVCPQCRITIMRTVGQSCMVMKCHQCGIPMARG